MFSVLTEKKTRSELKLNRSSKKQQCTKTYKTVEIYSQTNVRLVHACHGSKLQARNECECKMGGTLVDTGVYPG